MNAFGRLMNTAYLYMLIDLSWGGATGAYTLIDPRVPDQRLFCRVWVLRPSVFMEPSICHAALWTWHFFAAIDFYIDLYI